jgi:hypothetical protein
MASPGEQPALPVAEKEPPVQLVPQQDRPAQPASREQPLSRSAGPAKSYLLRNETPTRLTIRLQRATGVSAAIELPPLADTVLQIQGEARTGEALAPLIGDNRVAFRELTKGEKTDWSACRGFCSAG